MSGHSKFANIKHKKEKNDAAKGKIFTIIGREIAVAVKEGGPDPSNNYKLAKVIEKAKSNNVPNDTIERGIKKAAGDVGNVNYQYNTYEGYGPSGVAVIVEALTNNRQRTAPEIRHYFDKYGGNLGAQGCVSWSFDRKGVIVINNEDEDLDEEIVMMDALEAGAEDFEADGAVFEVTTDPDAFAEVLAALEAKGYTFVGAEVEMVPQNYIQLTGEDEIRMMEKLLGMLEDNEDVQNVWHNWKQE